MKRRTIFPLLAADRRSPEETMSRCVVHRTTSALRALLVVGLMAGAPACARAQASTRWEYGELNLGQSYWMTARTQIVTPGSVVELAKKLGVTIPPEGTTALPFLVLDRLGTQGWELVAVGGQGRVLLSEGTYLFKRRQGGS